MRDLEQVASIAIRYDGMELDEAFRIDFLIDQHLVIEIKSTEGLFKVHGKQLLTYLRSMQQPLALLMNFGAPTFKEGIRRVVNDHIFTPSHLRVNQMNSDAISDRKPFS